jgi:hypothetical protein
VLRSEYVEDNITTNGVERHLTMANVHIADSLGYARELLVIGPFGSFDGSNITFSQDPQSTANSDGSPCVEVNAQVSGRPYFNCTDCVFKNCSSIGTGGGVTAGPNSRLTLVRPRFVDCLAGYIGWSHTHKPGFGDGCYCENEDPSLCVGCTCKSGTAGGEPGWYCDSKRTGNSTGTCGTVLQGLCGKAKASSPGDCFICCGSHQQALHAAGCVSSDFGQFCGRPERTESSGSSRSRQSTK